MNLIDAAGYRVSGANPESLQHLERACREMLCLIGDPVASCERAIAAGAETTMAHVLRAWLHLIATEPAGLPVAREALAAAADLPVDDREHRHRDAAQALAAGRWQEAALRLEDLNARYPRDTLALQMGHQIDFLRGDSRMLRDRIARVLPAWDPAMPGWHAVLGMHAFGLEETGDYAQAERQGRRCVELEPRDGWGWHAVAHVHEMRNAPREGIAWLRPTRATWSEGSFLAMHNTWHLALFELELDAHDEVLRLYDEAIGGTGSGVVVDLVDASAMLWRLALRGVDVGGRWQPIADRWALALGDPAADGAGRHAFNDFHAMLAYVGAGRASAQQALLEAMELASARSDDNAVFTRAVGLPAARAVQALARGDAASALALLRPLRSSAHRFGGSHAQRDLIDLTLIDAAERAGDAPLAAALAAERAALRPASPLAQRLQRRLAAGALRPSAAAVDRV